MQISKQEFPYKLHFPQYNVFIKYKLHKYKATPEQLAERKHTPDILYQITNMNKLK